MKTNKITKVLIELICLVIIPIAVEVGFFNYHAWADDDYDSFLQDASILYDDEYVQYTWDIEGNYISSLEADFKSNDNFEYIIQYTYDDNGEILLDDGYASFGYAVTEINSRVDEFKLYIPCEADCEILNLVISNKKIINPIRMYAVFALVILIILLIDKEWIRKCKLHNLFFAISILSGVFIILYVGPSFKSWDEQIHFGRTWDLFNDGYSEKTTAESIYENYLFLDFNTYKEKNAYEQFMNENGEISDVSIKNSFIDYTHWAYLPSAIAINLGKFLNIPFMKILYLGKFFNLLFYSLIISLAVKFCEKLKYVIFVIGLMPVGVFIASAYGYDSFITAMTILGIGFIFEELLSNSKLNKFRLIIAVICVVIGCFSKTVYIPYLFIACFIPEWKYDSKKQMWISRIVIVALMMILMSTFIFPVANSALNGTFIAGDSRGGETSVSGQLSYILNSPFKYIILLVTSVVETAFPYLFINNAFFAYMPFQYNEIISFLYAIFLLIVIATHGAVVINVDKKRNFKLDVKVRIMMIIITLGVITLIWTALYMSFTTVGANCINGVQARYYIPIILPMAIIGLNSKLKLKMSEKYYKQGVSLVLLSVWVTIMWLIILYNL